jgi:hypothetical protein
MVAPYRPDTYPGLIALPWTRAERETLPAGMFSGAEQLFPELEDESHRVVALLAFTQALPLLANGFDWLAVRHQCGGLLCDQRHLVGIRLKLRAVATDWLRSLAEGYFEAAAGHFYASNLGASDIVAYSAALAANGVHCERSFRLFEEAVYPIDATQEHLDLLAEDAPVHSRIADPRGYGGLTIVVLAENSD